MALNIVGQMLVRNEADVIRETVTEIMRWVDTLVVLDGASDDGTLEILRDLAAEYGASYKKAIRVESRPDPQDEFHDHIRNELLELTAPFIRLPERRRAHRLQGTRAVRPRDSPFSWVPGHRACRTHFPVA